MICADAKFEYTIWHFSPSCMADSIPEFPWTTDIFFPSADSVSANKPFCIVDQGKKNEAAMLMSNESAIVMISIKRL